jgi:hypothetical protein
MGMVRLLWLVLLRLSCSALGWRGFDACLYRTTMSHHRYSFSIASRSARLRLGWTILSKCLARARYSREKRRCSHSWIEPSSRSRVIIIDRDTSATISAFIPCSVTTHVVSFRRAMPPNFRIRPIPCPSSNSSWHSSDPSPPSS